MIENINSINISIFLPSQKSKEITFELKEDKKNDKELIEDLINIVLEVQEQQKQMSNYSNSQKLIEELKNLVYEQQQRQISNNTQKLKNQESIEELKNLVLEQQKEISNLKKKLNDIDLDEVLLNLFHEQQKEISNLSKNLSDLKKFNIIRNYISNFNSLIIGNDIDLNSLLKNWIDPINKVKAYLLYRLSRDGPEIETFHKLCDNKGSTLTLIHLREGYKIWFYISDSIDSSSGWKKDAKNFIFNLNQKERYKKTYYNPLSYVNKYNSGPSSNGLGCNENVKLNFIFYSGKYLDQCYENGSKVIPNQSDDGEKKYEVTEMEIFQIKIG